MIPDVNDGRATLGWLLAHEQIRQLAYRYAEAVDARDVDELVSLFVEDVQVGRDRFGRPALRSWFDDVLRTFGVSAHLVGNHRITLDDDVHASGVVYCRADHEVDGHWVEMTIQYWDTYECREGRWLFRRRREMVWYSTVDARTAAGPDKDRWPGRPDRPGRLPDAWPTWTAFWDERRTAP